MSGPRQLWGADLTLVWVLGLLPVWILGVVDYHGSRLVSFDRLGLWPTAAQIAARLEAAMAAHGAPDRLLTDRGSVFRAAEVESVLAAHGTRHVLILPCHCWTNGRIERVFRTFKETLFRHLRVWLLTSVRQVDRFCSDFALFYNRDRPHSAYGGRTPDEVFLGRRSRRPAADRVRYFDGRLAWYRFG